MIRYSTIVHPCSTESIDSAVINDSDKDNITDTSTTSSMLSSMYLVLILSKKRDIWPIGRLTCTTQLISNIFLLFYFLTFLQN